MSRFDADEDMRLSFWEFANMMLPMEASLRDDVERRSRSRDYGMTAETRMLLKTLIRQSIDAECMVEAIR